MLKRLALLLGFCCALAAHAAPPSTQSIETLLTVTKSERLIGSMTANLEQTMRQALAQASAGKSLTAEQQRFLDAAPAQFARVMREELSWNSLKAINVQIYQETFTQEEIDGLIAFYSSPAGAAFVDKMPIVMQKSMVAMQSRLQPMMEKMKAAMDKALADAGLAR